MKLNLINYHARFYTFRYFLYFICVFKTILFFLCVKVLGISSLSWAIELKYKHIYPVLKWKTWKHFKIFWLAKCSFTWIAGIAVCSCFLRRWTLLTLFYFLQLEEVPFAAYFCLTIKWRKMKKGILLFSEMKTKPQSVSGSTSLVTI